MWIGIALREFVNALKDQEDSYSGAQQTSEPDGRNQPGVVVAVSPDQGKDTSKPTHKKDRTVQVVIAVAACVTAVATLIAAGGALIYACIANHQAWLMKTSVNQTEEAMELDERAWVSFSGMQESLATKDTFVGSEIINTGKTPAKNISIAIATFARDGDIDLAEGDSALLEHILTVPPVWNESAHLNYQLTDDQRLADSSKPFLSAPLPTAPNRQLVLYIYAPQFAPHDIVGRSLLAPMHFRAGALSPDAHYPIPVLSIGNWYQKRASSQAVVDFGRITYSDIFNRTLRVTTFCSELHKGSEKFGPCPIFNDMK